MSAHTLKLGTQYDGNYYIPTNSDLKKAAKVAYFGWYQEMGTLGSNGWFDSPALKRYALTQQMIWEVLGQSNARFVDDTVQNEYIQFKNDVNDKMEQMSKRPSFDGTEIILTLGETKTINDGNGVLAEYKSIDITEQGIRIIHNQGENNITLAANNDCTIEKLRVSDEMTRNWGLIKEGTENYDTTVYIEFQNDVQDQLYSLNYNDPVTTAFSLKVEALGRLEIIKTNANNDLINGSIFQVTGPNGFNKEVVVENGRIIVEKLKPGTYQIKEKSSSTRVSS